MERDSILADVKSVICKGAKTEAENETKESDYYVVTT